MAAILHQAPFAFEPASPLAAVASLLRAVRLNELAKSSIEAKPPAPVGTPLVVVPLLLLTFMLGPVGLLTFLVIRSLRRNAPPDEFPGATV